MPTHAEALVWVLTRSMLKICRDKHASLFCPNVNDEYNVLTRKIMTRFQLYKAFFSLALIME
jgi:hypothetical protein